MTFFDAFKSAANYLQTEGGNAVLYRETDSYGSRFAFHLSAEPGNPKLLSIGLPLDDFVSEFREVDFSADNWEVVPDRK